ncbi:IS66 family transposase [Myxococcus sp. SDU36]|uniref:IS66 family transposase n=1 Tax=Myxococcus sp. SDU36 TaxID=2831967 RepID=UPI002543B621|nr:IS66 family transposase [Myxococcus sp. SDU36]WIG92578.1 IS66 family transposase [Myxococcus sp. SDU36]
MPGTAPTSETTKKPRRGPVLEVLKALLAEGRTEEVVALVARLVSRNSELERLLQDAKTKGKKSEGVSTTQLKLLLDGLPANSDGDVAEVDARLRRSSGIDEEPPQEEPARPKRTRPAPRPIPTNLRRVENVIPVPAPQRPCPRCAEARECVGHEVTEVIDLIPAEVIVRQDKREKLACRLCEAEVVRAPLGEKVVSGGRMGARLVAQLLVEKYYDGLPLSRQVERFERLGLEVALSTLADQVAWATEALRPVWRAAMSKVLGATVMHLDATSLPVLDSKNAKGIRLGAIWGYVGADVKDCGTQHTALCLYNSTGKREGQREGELGPAQMLALREGRTVADAAGIFDASFKRAGLLECGCNTHARRYFRKALDGGDKRAALPLAAFKRLFAIERRLKACTIDERRRGRQERSKPVYDDLIAWAIAHQPNEPPSSPLGRAIRYLLNHQQALRRYLEDGVIPIDNTVVERLHIRTALTRKNFLFAGSDAGGERAAIAYTLLGCCKLAEVDPVAYLADVLPRLATKKLCLRDMPALLPTEWKRSHPEAVRGKAAVAR